MRSIVVAVSALVFLGSANVWSACGGTRVSAGTVSGTTVAASSGSETWNEEHCPGGNLYKVGTLGSAVDPRALRGTWSVVTDNSQEGLVEYDYGSPSVTYQWSLWQLSGGSYCWEDSSGNAIATGTLTVGTGACP